MSAVDELIDSLAASKKVDDGTRTILVDFLRAAAPTLENLEASALRGLMEWIAGGATIAAPPAVDALNAQQVAALLTVTESQMATALAARVQQVANARAAITQMGNSAFTLLAQLLIRAL